MLFDWQNYFFMNKKIYFNHKFIEITTENPTIKTDPGLLMVRAPGEKELADLLSQFLDAANPHSFRIVTNETFKSLFNGLKKNFSYIEAAGGFIKKDKEFLCIHRHGRWDLPKGKLEKNEGIETAAVRECEEECGVKNLVIVKPLPSTFHIYPYKTGHALKQTYWFYMETDYNKKLVPQQEEDIDEVKWFTKNELEAIVLNDTYYTISDTITEGLRLL
jgi:8-oxo-dGTP pyrophosphatase MutT (NUDIX family)